jgi:NodT family efflux transporter outer membrane factor (OMF) lipoprotein
MNTRRVLTVFCLLMMTASCAVGPDYVRPEPPVAQTYSNERDLNQFGKQEIKQDKQITEQWWQEFECPELNAVVDRGIKNSHLLASVRKNVEQAIEAVNAEKGLLWPQVSLQASAGREKYGAAFLGSDSKLIPPFTYYELGPSLTYMLDVFGSTRRAIENQQALADYEVYAYNGAYLNLTGKIVSTSLAIATINAQIEAAEKIIKQDKETLALVEKAYTLGGVNKNKFFDAKKRLANDGVVLTQLQLQRAKTKNELNTLVGSAPTEWTPPNFQLSWFKLPKELPLSLPSQLVRTRPDILAAESVLHAANANIGVATANLYPNIVLTGDFLQEAITPSKLFNAQSSAWSYLGSLTAPVINGGLLRAQKRIAIKAYEASFENYQDVVVKSLVQVNDVLHALKLDAEADRFAKQSIGSARDSLELAKKNREVGGIATLELLDVERDYLLEKLMYSKIQGQRYQNTVQLYLALGGKNYDEGSVP